MKIKGIVTGIIRDAATGEFKRSFTVENDVTNYQLGLMASLLTVNNLSSRFGPNIFISDETGTIIEPRNQYVGNVLDIGFVESGVTSPVSINPPADTGSPKLKTPPYIQIQQRFAPPTTDRIITIIGLTADTAASTNVVTYTRALAEAWVVLTPTCSQTSTETLDVFYRVQFLYGYDLSDPADQNPASNEISFSKNSAFLAAEHYAVGSTLYFYRAHHVWHGGENFNNNKTQYGFLRDSHDYLSSNPNPNPLSITYFPDLLKTDINMDYDISIYIGKLMGSIAYGDSGSNPTYIHDVRNVISRADGDSPIQGVFGHNATATKPFFDSAATQSGTGTFSLDGLGWINPDWPKMYRIDVIDAGATGTATYKLKIRNHFGFYLNTYREQERAMIQMGGAHKDTNYEGFAIGNDVVAWLDYKQLKWYGLAVNPDELCIVNFSRQTGVRTHVSTQPIFTATKIGVVHNDEANDVLWIPCRETGLYKVTDPSNTRVVVKINTPASGSPSTIDRCMGIAFTPDAATTGQRMWALWSDSVGDSSLNALIGLYWTENEGASWTQDTTWAPETMTSWLANQFNTIPYIVGDPNHVDMRLLIPYNTASTSSTRVDYGGMWHDQVNATVQGVASPSLGRFYRVLSVTGTNRAYIGDDPRTFGKVPSVSPTDGKWGGYAPYSSTSYLYYYTYGTTSTISTSTMSPFSEWINDENGNDALLYVTGTTTATMGVYKDDNTIVTEPITETGHAFSTPYATTRSGLLYLGEGICFGSSYYFAQVIAGQPDATGNFSIATLSTINQPNGHFLSDLNVWTEYGWDGANWVAGNAGTKTIHSTAEALFDGVTIQFADGVGQAGNAGNWIATDYYTFGVTDGVWLDGSTELHQKAALYFKPATTKNTAIESANLPVTTKTVDTKDIIPALTYNISSGGETSSDNGRALYLGSYVVNSFDKYIQTNEYHSATAIGNPAHPGNDVHVGLTFNFNADSSSINRQFILGLSSASRITATPTPDATTTEFAIRVDPPTNATSGYVDLSVVHSGVVQATYPNYQQRVPTLYQEYFKIEIKKTGHIVYSVRHTSHGEIILHDTSSGSPVPPAPIDMTPGTLENYHIEFVSSGGSYCGYRDLFIYGPSDLDYYVELGTQGNSTGYYNPKLYSIDYDTDFSITIDGVDGVDAGADNAGNDYLGTITPLNTGEYSLFRETGVIRYSSADTSKAIAVIYNEISND